MGDVHAFRIGNRVVLGIADAPDDFYFRRAFLPRFRLLFDAAEFERKRQKRDEENTRADSQYENNDVFRLHKFFLLDSFGLDTASALQRESEGKGAPSSRPDFFVPFRALHDG